MDRPLPIIGVYEDLTIHVGHAGHDGHEEGEIICELRDSWGASPHLTKSLIERAGYSTDFGLWTVAGAFICFAPGYTLAECATSAIRRGSPSPAAHGND